jgi:aryl-alcohol dehydrogenase-like predicted oxidoreductase
VIELSPVGLGTNNFGRRIDLARAREVVDAGLEEGVTHFDTADIYGDGDSERFLGEILGGRRGEAVVATKFGHARGGSPDYVPRALDASLARLRTDYVDIFYYHRPDGVTPIAETVGAMNELVEAGKVCHLGVSNVNAAQLREAVATARVAVVQNEYNLLKRGADDDVLPACRELGVGFVPYFPLASGLLTGKYRRGEPGPQNARLAGREIDSGTFDRIEALARSAHARGLTLLDLAVGELLLVPGVASVIAGATTAEQVRANAAAGRRALGAPPAAQRTT